MEVVVEDDRQKVFQNLLASRLEALINNASGHLGAMVERRESHADAADVASEESSREFSLRLHEHERQTIGAIRAALRRIEEGDYGYCVACGEDIGERRLMARPMTTHCIDCKTEGMVKLMTRIMNRRQIPRRQGPC